MPDWNGANVKKYNLNVGLIKKETFFKALGLGQ
jgi:hypothetical protein